MGYDRTFRKFKNNLELSGEFTTGGKTVKFTFKGDCSSFKHRIAKSGAHMITISFVFTLEGESGRYQHCTAITAEWNAGHTVSSVKQRMVAELHKIMGYLPLVWRSNLQDFSGEIGWATFHKSAIESISSINIDFTVGGSIVEASLEGICYYTEGELGVVATFEV